MPISNLASQARLERPYRELLTLAAPLVAVSASRILMSFVDVAMVARLGTDALAAISPAAFLVWIFIWAGMGIASSAQTFAAQSDGRGEPERGAEYTWQTIYFALPAALAAALIAAALPTVYRWIGAVGGQTPAVLQAQADYAVVTIWALVPAVAAAGLEGFFNGVKRPGVTLVASLVSLGVNVLFNWLLIFGPTLSLPALGPLPAWSVTFPAWGIWGAGLATVIGWWARLAVLLAAFLAPGFNARFRTRHALAVRWRAIADILRIGVPMAAMGVLELGSWVVFLNLIAPRFGTAALAATNIAMQYTHVAFMPAVGIGLALCSQVGFAVGAGRPHEAVYRARVALHLNMVYMGLAGLALFLARGPLLWVMSSDADVLAIGGWIMLWVALYQVFDAMGITFIFALRGAGDTRVPALLNGACCWSLFVGGGWLLAEFAPQFGIHGPWLMAVAYLTLLGLLVAWRFRSGAWRKVQIFSASAPAAAGAVPRPDAELSVDPQAAAAQQPA